MYYGNKDKAEIGSQCNHLIRWYHRSLNIWLQHPQCTRLFQLMTVMTRKNFCPATTQKSEDWLEINYSLCNILPCNLWTTISERNDTQREKKTDGKGNKRRRPIPIPSFLECGYFVRLVLTWHNIRQQCTQTITKFTMKELGGSSTKIVTFGDCKFLMQVSGGNLEGKGTMIHANTANTYKSTAHLNFSLKCWIEHPTDKDLLRQRSTFLIIF